MEKAPILIASIIAAVSTLASPLPLRVFKSETAASYCPIGIEGYHSKTSEAAYSSGERVDFCLSNDTKVPLFLAPSWQILDPNDRVIYEEKAAATSQLHYYTYQSSWNQKSNEGNQVPPGVYSLVFPNLPNKAKINFVITPERGVRAEAEVKTNSWSADPSPTVGEERQVESSKPGETIQGKVALSKNYLTNYYLKPGESTNFYGRVDNYDYKSAVTVSVSVEIYDAQENMAAQSKFENISLRPFQYKELEVRSPQNLGIGKYYYVVKIYEQDSGRLVGQYPYQNFTVAD